MQKEEWKLKINWLPDSSSQVISSAPSLKDITTLLSSHIRMLLTLEGFNKLWSVCQRFVQPVTVEGNNNSNNWYYSAYSKFNSLIRWFTKNLPALFIPAFFLALQALILSNFIAFIRWILWWLTDVTDWKVSDSVKNVEDNVAISSCWNVVGHPNRRMLGCRFANRDGYSQKCA